MKELNYHHLRYFRAVAHDGNLTRTAQRLNISQSALSVQIRALEDRLGQPLFERRGRQLHLTEAGRIVLDHADTIFAAGEDLIGSLSGLGGRRQPLRVGALSTLSRNFQLDFLRPLLDRQDVELILRSGGLDMLLDDLESLNLDMVLSNRAVVRDTVPPFLAYKLAEQQASLIGTPDRLAKASRSLPHLLNAHPVILPTAHSPIRTAFDALADRLGIDLRIAAEVDDMAMMRLLAREDMGLAVLPPIVVKDELHNGVLQEVQPLTDVTESFYAITIKRRFPNPLAQALLDAPLPAGDRPKD